MLIALIVLGLIVFVLYVFQRKIEVSGLAGEVPLPYRRKDYLLTQAEREFFNVLYPIAQEHNWYLFVKVRLEDLFWLPKGIFKNKRWSLRGRIKSRHVDFVLCDKANIRPLAAIELDDSSHDRADRIKRDGFYERLFKNAGLLLIRIPLGASYNSQEIASKIILAQQINSL